LSSIPLLVVGAGPYGLATAALAKHRGIETVVVGEPMGFWRDNMPKGMLLRSGLDWHLDPLGIHTLRAYLEEGSISEEDVQPLPVELFIDYAEWYATNAGVAALEPKVSALRRPNGRGFMAELEDGSTVTAEAVVATPGLRYFASVPRPVREALAPDRYSHTCTMTRFGVFEGGRVLILGGRQSAFEWGALIAEQAGATIEIVFRHDAPSFEPSDWRFVEPLLAKTLKVRGWFRRLKPAEQEAITARFWAEGRLKLEPWLAPRISRPAIAHSANCRVVAYRERPSGEVEVRLSDGRRLVVDHVILATGYRTDMARVPYLHASLVSDLELRNGFPVLDESFQSTIPGLFFPSWPSTQDFGPFFGFVAGVPAAATMVVRKLTEQEGGQWAA
jgi:cation diffusion facilitator CzcD-associated flavoprotein CzcO